jgi:ubiquinone/menaquinone biosynthesis C-methylase UbiE
MSTEHSVAEHYGRAGLEDLVLAALARQGKDLKEVLYTDLAPLDEFHVGGLESTQELAGQMDLRPGSRLLDVGSGLGGPARYVAAEYGCRINGIDLTEEFVKVAASLTRLLNLDHLADFQQASALALPFEPNTFDRAWMIHVGMNIPDKTSVYREVRRVLKPNGLFVIFDFMRAAEGPLRYPVPWAVSQETSFVSDVAGYRQALADAGFRVIRERGRRAFAVDFTQRMMARMAESGPPAVGLHLLLGDKAPVMARNMLSMMEDSLIEPVEMFTCPS